MNRLKVLVFALIALGLWVFNLTTLSSAVATKAVEQTSTPLLSASGAVAQRIEASRSAIQAAVLKLAANPALLQKPGARAEAPTPERFNQLRTAAWEGLADSARATAYMALVNDQGALMAFGTAEPTPAPEGFDVKGAVAGGGDGVLLEMNGTPCLFFSVPVVGLDRGEVKAVANVVLGAPLWGTFATVDALSDSVNKDLNLSGVGLWMKGKLVGSAGKKDALEKAFKEAKPGQTTVVERGSVGAMGPFKLPMFVGTANALDVAARKDIPGTPFEVVAIASARPFMESLASAQKISLLLLLGLIAAGIVFTLLVSQGGVVEEEEDVAAPKPESKRVTALAPAHSGAMGDSTTEGNEALTRAERVEPLAGTLTDTAAAVDEPATPAFEFPPAPPPPPLMSAASTIDGPMEDPFASAGPPSEIAQPLPVAAHLAAPPPLSLADDDYDNQRTTAYPMHRPPPMAAPVTDSHSAMDPFAMAGGPAGDLDNGDNPDATRVAAIPPELLKSARRDGGMSTGSNASFKPPGAMPVAAPRVQPLAPAVGSDEDQHFQETFRDFLSTRQKCGEPNDGMTYDKFAAKLRKNKEQLVAKYNCRTVRFQVYVKDGKAALKATPVKD